MYLPVPGFEPISFVFLERAYYLLGHSGSNLVYTYYMQKYYTCVPNKSHLSLTTQKRGFTETTGMEKTLKETQYSR